MPKFHAFLALCAFAAIFGATYFALSYVLSVNSPEVVDTSALMGQARESQPATATVADVADATEEPPTRTSVRSAEAETTPSAAPTVRPSATATTRPAPEPTATPAPPTRVPPTPVPPTPVPPTPVPPTPVPPTPTARPTAVPQPTATRPAVTPTTPATEPPTNATASLVERVVAAEATLRSGQIDAMVAYTDGARSTTRIRFDFGGDDEPPRASISTTYERGDQRRTTEQVMIGTDIWERINGGNWQAAGNAEGVWGQVQVYLPRISALDGDQVVAGEADDELRWHDPARNVDVTLRVDPDNGEPEAMTQVLRGTGTTLEVTYSGWNTPVRIERPVD